MSGEYRDTWALLRPHALPRLPALGAAFLASAVVAVAEASPLLLLQPLWSQVLFPGTSGGGVAAAGHGALERLFARLAGAEPGALDGDERLRVLGLVVAAALALAVLGGAARFAAVWLQRKVALGMVVDLRVRMARHLMSLSMRYHGSRKLGDLLSRVSADVQTTLYAINTGFKGLVQEPLKALGYLALALYVAPYATLVVVLLLPLAAAPISQLSRRVRRGSTRSMTSLGASVQALTQMFQGVRAVKSFRAEERELEHYRELNEGWFRASMRMVRSVALTHAWSAFFGTAAVAVLTLVLGWLTIRYGLFQDPAAMIQFFAAAAAMSQSAKNATKSFTSVQESMGAGVRLRQLLDERPDVVERPGARPIDAVREGIRFERVSMTYPGASEPAVRDLDLELRVGETLAIVGPSGAGKSTVVDLLSRFVDPSEGRITVDGVDLRDLRLDDWTALYAVVGQHPFLFHSSIAENIRYGRPGAAQAEVEEAARAAYIHDFVASLPQAYDTDVADMGARLSGGQRQRITIARALLKGAPLLLLDEATSALDSESEAEVQRALERLMRGRTVVVIAHRLSTVQGADRIAVLEDGRLVELGTHEELVRRGGAYARLWSLQRLDVAAAR